ncbi:divalent-cation tolerance protein CutA [Ferrovibrio xuzhouensis]|uniref:Divalent-cation tolerance protein CutA n=1 Tax=Ferrovibrio xuzhouensis TaxID=1576914 RepID=A0ABV7VI39_9PROT
MSDADRIVLLYCTAASVAEAEKIAEAVVGQRLAACANIIPGMTSLYWWQGKLERGEEAVLILKTRASLAEAATAAVKAAHSYSVPCVLPLDTAGGNADYLAWLLAETTPGA